MEEETAEDVLCTDKKKSLRSYDCSGVVHGECLLPGGIEGCSLCQCDTSETYTTTQTENIK
jgi:hypothetical protein